MRLVIICGGDQGDTTTPIAKTSFDSPAARIGDTATTLALWRAAGGKRNGPGRATATAPGETGWWCPAMRVVLWATLGAVGATGLLLFGVPALS